MFFTRRMFASLLALGLMTGAAQATVVPLVCGPHDDISATLDKKFKERRQGMGLVSSTGVVELFLSEQGTWTMVATGTEGRSCVIAAGHSWEAWDAKPVQSAL